MALFAYSRWDGSQAGFDLDADDVFAEIKDDLMYHGDVGHALRRMLQEGFSDRNGRHVEGLQELLERIRERVAAKSASSTISEVPTARSPTS